MLLARGKIIYFNKASESVDYFTNIGFKCPELSNPCDYFMSMMSIESIELEIEDGGEGTGGWGYDTGKIKEEYEKLIAFFDAKYEASELRCDASEKCHECVALTGGEDSIKVQTSFCY